MTHENYRQKDLFEPNDYQSAIDWEYSEPFVDKYAPKADDSQQRREAELIERADRESDLSSEVIPEVVGPYTPLNTYYENALEMITEVCGANRGRYFVAKNTTTEGFSDTVEQYGSVREAQSVNTNTGRRAIRLQNRMDILFQSHELAEAGFAVEAIQAASKKHTAELTALYTGTHNEENRTEKRKELRKKLKAANKRLSSLNT